MADYNHVLFMSGTYDEYEPAKKNSNTLYFISDKTHNAIYKGDVLMTGGEYRLVEEYPETGILNVLYVNTDDGSAKFWDGTAYQTVIENQTVIVSADADGYPVFEIEEEETDGEQGNA